jgi:ketosteroid isomerase-like protein
VGEAAEVVRAAFERANANDLDGLVELCDQTIEFHDVPEIPGSTTYRGPEGVRDWLRTVHEISDDLRLDPREVEENGTRSWSRPAPRCTASGHQAAPSRSGGGAAATHVGRPLVAAT